MARNKSLQARRPRVGRNKFLAPFLPVAKKLHITRPHPNLIKSTHPPPPRFLEKAFSTHPLQLILQTQGKGYVEVKLKGVNKGVAVQTMMSEITAAVGDVDFVLCIGDDRTDEDMFDVVNIEAGLREEQGDDGASTTSGDNQSAGSGGQSGRHGGSRRPGGSGGFGSLTRSGGLLGGKSHGSHSNLSGFASSRNTSYTGLADMAGGGEPGKSGRQGGAVLNRFFSVTVGRKPSHARYFLDDVDQVSDLLNNLSNTKATKSKVHFLISFKFLKRCRVS